MKTLNVAVRALILSGLLSTAGWAQQRIAPSEGPTPSGATVPGVSTAAGSAPKGGPKTSLSGAHDYGQKPKTLPGTNGAPAPVVPPASGTPLQSGPVAGGVGARKALTPPGVLPKGAWPGGSPADHNPKPDNTTSDNSAEAGVSSLTRPHPLPGYSHGHGVAVSKAVLSKAKTAKPVVGDYTNTMPVFRGNRSRSRSPGCTGWRIRRKAPRNRIPSSNIPLRRLPMHWQAISLRGDRL